MMGFDWNHLRAFLTTVETGSLSAAARALAVTQPTLSRQIAALETELGVLLFDRVGRRLHLTESGRQLAEHVRAMAGAADRFALAATGQSQAVEGVVKIAAVNVVAAYLVPPILETLHETAPGVSIDIIASNSINDLMRREADIAIRHIEPTQPDLIARRCKDTPLGLYASTRFLDANGRPERAQDLAGLPFVAFAQDDGLPKQLNDRGVPVNPIDFKWFCTDGLVGLELIRQGLGLGVTFQCAAGTMADLEPVLSEIDPLLAPIWLVAHRELHSSRRIRIVFDALAAALS